VSALTDATQTKKRFYKRPIFFVPAIIVAIPAVWLAWWLGSPLFIDKTVIEAFPTVSTVVTPAVTQAPAATQPPPSDSPEGEVAVAPADQPATSPTTAVPADAAPATTEAPAEPVALLSGMFKDADSRHHGSGDATIYELADGTVVLRVENLDVTNGPDLHVFLAPVADADERDDVMAEGYLDLGELKGNKGDQNYIILGNFDPTREWTVVIYCVPFHVIFSTAPLGPAA
jgi:hypothetical protein